MRTESLVVLCVENQQVPDLVQKWWCRVGTSQIKGFLSCWVNLQLFLELSDLVLELQGA